MRFRIRCWRLTRRLDRLEARAELLADEVHRLTTTTATTARVKKLTADPRPTTREATR